MMTVTECFYKPYTGTRISKKVICTRIYIYVCVISVIVSYPLIFRGILDDTSEKVICHVCHAVGGAV